MAGTLPILFAGLTLGLSAGLAPGPLTALVLSESVRHGRGAGIRVSLAPLVTDAPIVAVALLLISRISNTALVSGAISFLGAAFVAWLAWEGWRAAPVEAVLPAVPAQSLRKGVITNFLNPHPYLYWLTVGAPTTVRLAKESGIVAAIGFVSAFYFGLVGTKIVMAVFAGQSRQWLSGRGYRIVNRVLAMLLLVFALVLVRDGIRFLIYNSKQDALAPVISGLKTRG